MNECCDVRKVSPRKIIRQDRVNSLGKDPRLLFSSIGHSPYLGKLWHISITTGIGFKVEVFENFLRVFTPNSPKGKVA